MSTIFVHTFFVKNVTISLDDGLLAKGREFARSHGKSFHEFVRDLLGSTVEDRETELRAAWEFADRLRLSLKGAMPSPEERNARS